jgi:hypothetical protein
VWALAALPFIILGSLCAAPNLNLANGILVLLCVVVGLVVAHFHRELGTWIFMGAGISWLLSSIEKRVRAVRLDSDTNT